MTEVELFGLATELPTTHYLMIRTPLGKLHTTTPLLVRFQMSFATFVRSAITVVILVPSGRFRNGLRGLIFFFHPSIC